VEQAPRDKEVTPSAPRQDPPTPVPHDVRPAPRLNAPGFLIGTGAVLAWAYDLIPTPALVLCVVVIGVQAALSA
jgi:hypothetical protein